ncbi:MAG: apolipoprotein N-acyltransferase [Pelagibacteraceae bacterium TMED232]|nr:MAG: apolipoprotein N-acyltransferase [Pelagibacteraceae bacterium TMED232]
MLTSLSLPPYNYFIINFFTFTAFFYFLIKKLNQKTNKKLFFIYGWLFGFGYFFSNLYWISISLTFDQNYKFLIPFTIFLIPSFLAVFYGVVSFIFLIYKPKKILSSLLLFSLIFGIIEFIRGSILTGFPWNLIAYSFSNQIEFISIISIIGTYGFNLFCILLFTCPAIFLLKEKNKDISMNIIISLLVILILVYGSFYKNKYNSLANKTLNYKLRIIGSNVELNRFYQNVDSVSIIEELIKISKPNLNDKTIFVWPEGILPEISHESLNEYEWLFSEKFSENHLIIIGMNTRSIINNSENYFNSLSLYDNDLKLLSSYNKINLVPFGEFLPFETFLKNIGLRPLTNNYQSFSSGNKREIIEINKQNFSLKILPLICYEIIYSGKLFSKSNFDLIINISEDGWFGKSIGPKQHFTHSIFRALESGKYVVRSSNNGKAAVVNPLGIVEQSVKFGQSGFIDLTSTKKIQPTIFSQYGNKIFVLLILMYIVLILLLNKKKNE